MIEERELAFLEELKKHENKWVALVESDGAEVIVGSGDDAVQATRDAEAKGFKDAVLYRVQPFDRGYIPSILG
jgi:hypothetical protein